MFYIVVSLHSKQFATNMADLKQAERPSLSLNAHILPPADHSDGKAGL